MIMFFYWCIILLFQTVQSGQISGNLFPQLPIGVTDTDNLLCKKHSELYRQHLENFTLWAYELWDSTAKSSTGVLRGSIFQMGHYDQCLTTHAPFETKYCLATFNMKIPKQIIKDPKSLYHDPYESVLKKLYFDGDPSQQPRNVAKVGWCIPASCTLSDLQKSLENYVEQNQFPLKELNVTYEISMSPLVCQTQSGRKQLDIADIFFCLLVFVLVVLVVGTTCYDLANIENMQEKPKKRTLPFRLLMTFSAKKNFKDLNKADESNPALRVLYGMRTFCILMVILDHRFGTFTSSALLNFNFVEGEYRSPLACFIFHGDLFVDSFFILSGLLVTYSLLNQLNKRVINPGFIILMRYIRLTPVYAFVIFYYATLFGHTGDGPLWKVIAGEDSNDCKKNWWTNLLYINNYVNVDHMCMTHSWYLPCDFHYFIIAIGVCFLIHKNKKKGLGVLTALSIASLVIPFALTVYYRRPAILHFYPEFLTGPKIHPDFQLTYSKSHTRATPYFVGMFTGYLYYILKDSNKHVCRTKSFLILLGSLILILLSLIVGAIFYNPYNEYNAIGSGAYASLHRLTFALGSSGILYVASYGHGAFFYHILSWKPWIPLSKIVYSVYLIHMQFQLRAAAKFMNPRFFSYFDTISLALSDMVLAFAAGLCLYLTIEAPFRRIFKELLMPSKEPERKVECNQEQANGNGNCVSHL